MAQAFVTGGSGFIGQRLVTRLVNDGDSVRVLVRSEESAAVVAKLGAEPVRGDLTDPSGLQEALIGRDVVYHLAAETDVDADMDRQMLVTVDGTRAVVEAARTANVARFVHCGSEAALLAGEPLVEVDETAPLRPESSAPYCAAKARAEKIVLDANSADLATVVVRPRFVWGPNSTLTDGLVEAANAGHFVWVDGGTHTTDVTYVDNAVQGLVLGFTRGKPGQAYFVTDQHRVVFREFMGKIFDAYGVEVTIPVMSAAAADDALPVPVRWFLGQTCTLKTTKAESDLGYQAIVSHDVGLAAVRDWAAGNRS